MLAVFGIMLLSFAVALAAVHLYRAVGGGAAAEVSVVVRSPGRRHARMRRQRGFVRTLDGVQRDRSAHRVAPRRGRSGADGKIRKPWGW